MEILKIFVFLISVAFGSWLYMVWRTWEWDSWVANDAGGPPVFFIKDLFTFTRRSAFFPNRGKWKVQLHKFIAADRPNCFHTHPAYAWRLILWGGYVEETYREYEQQTFSGGQVLIRRIETETKLQTLRPGSRGWIQPEFCHRIESLRNARSSYSLWVRGPIVADVELKGSGWTAGDSGKSEHHYPQKEKR